jgi:hypothetical protein
MALKKPTISSCVDGKDHLWLIVAEEKNEDQPSWEHRWCQKCGALTQVTYDEAGQAIAVMDQNNSHFLMLPKVLAGLAK